MPIHARLQLARERFVLDVDIELPDHGVTALFGRSGSGKTTLLRCLAGLERGSRGSLRFGNQVWQHENRFVPAHERPIGYVFQDNSLFPHLSVARNLVYGYRRVPPEERRLQPEQVIDWLGLAPLLERHPNTLSGGQLQRVAIGRALLSSPGLLLMDEPVVSLDQAAKDRILPYLENLREQLRIPIIYVSHSMSEVIRLADHMVLIEDGQILADGPLQQILTRTDLPLAHGEQAGSLITGRLVRQHRDDHLSEVSVGNNTLFVPWSETDPRHELRIRILARDVSIALDRPTRSSILNHLACRISEITADPHPGYCLLRLSLGEQQMLSRITRRSVAQLGLKTGDEVWAAVKSVSLGSV